MPPRRSPPLDHACFARMARFWADYPGGQALVIALGAIVGDEAVNGCPQRPVSKQVFLMLRTNSYSVRIQIRPSWRQLDGLRPNIGEHVQEPGREQRVTIMDQVALAIEDSVDGAGSIPYRSRISAIIAARKLVPQIGPRAADAPTASSRFSSAIRTTKTLIAPAVRCGPRPALATAVVFLGLAKVVHDPQLALVHSPGDGDQHEPSRT